MPLLAATLPCHTLPSLPLLAQGATLSQKHGVTVERVEMKHHHKEVVKEVIGRSTADLTPSESKKLAIKKAVAEAVHKVRASCCHWTAKGYERFVSRAVAVLRRRCPGRWALLVTEDES